MKFEQLNNIGHVFRDMPLCFVINECLCVGDEVNSLFISEPPAVVMKIMQVSVISRILCHGHLFHFNLSWMVVSSIIGTR